MKKIILTLLLAISGVILFAQKKTDTTEIRPENNIYLNIIGDASIISANYERLFFITPHFFLSGKLGIGYNEEFKLNIFGPSSPPKQYLTIPHHITVNFGKRRSFLEFGLGGTIFNGNIYKHYWLYTIVGYRFQPLKLNKVNFRIFGCIPSFTGLPTKDILFIPFGLSLGISF